MSDQSVRRFAKKVRPFLKRSEEDVEEARKYSKKQGKAEDWPWNRFLHAMSSMGGVSHWDRKIAPRLKNGELSWDRVVRLSAAHRKMVFNEIPNPRWRAHLSVALEQIFDRVKTAGGPAAIRREYQRIKSAPEAIKYWKSFPGIGDKYAREIPMRSYDPLFRHHFALDHRLNGLLKRNFKERFSYADGEDFLQQVANELGVDCWTLDTVLFNNYDELIQ